MDFLFNYKYFALPVIVIWAIALILLVFYKKKALLNLSLALIITGLFVHVLFVIILWLKLERAPMRTLGETRLWYALFLTLVGVVMYFKWKLIWIIPFSVLLSVLFLTINLYHPENFDKTLMPALQSYWFVPHVIVYIFAYAALAAATLIAMKGLYQNRKNKYDPKTLYYADNIVYIGFAFLTFGLLFGALWAKEAWGSYWTWDPKETWAFVTWLLYLVYLHYRYKHKNAEVVPLWILSFAFVVLLTCWFGLNYLPTAANSVHTYSGN